MVTPNGNSGLNTTLTYASSFAATSVTAPGTNSATVTYDAYGRPSQSQIPDGAVTTYTYTYNPPTQTATMNNKWRTTTLDGFGRTIQVDSGHDSVSLANTVSRVATLYAPCACSPLLKVWAVTTPYNPNPNSGSPGWTTYTYDGSGRTIAVTLIATEGASTTTTSYAGNSTTVTDPAGKWKTSTVDAFGNLTLVTEPNPAGGANWTTSYAYNNLSQLTQVSMTRPQGTQTRTFAYTGADMTSATNPENGTVTYTYDNAHHVATRTDALGQQTQYFYDVYGRVTQVSHGTMSGGTFIADPSQWVDYGYDSSGRLGSVWFGRQDNQGYNLPLAYSYAYSSAGRVTTQTMTWSMYNPINPGSPHAESMTETYGWDNEGKMTSMGAWNTYQYDNMGRLNGITANYNDGWGPWTLASATYGPAVQLLSLTNTTPGLPSTTVNESFGYNALLSGCRFRSG